MRILLNFLGWIGIIAFILPILSLIFINIAPESLFIYSDFVPSDFLFNTAFWVAIFIAIMMPCSLLLFIINENNLSFLGKIIYFIIWIIFAFFGLIFGYTGTIQTGFIIASSFNPGLLEKSEPYKLSIENKKSKKDDNITECDHLIIGKHKENLTFYEKYFYPNMLCITKDLYDDINKNDNIFLLGKSNNYIGFFLNGIITEKDLENMKK
jgi:hypothetical protein